MAGGRGSARRHGAAAEASGRALRIETPPVPPAVFPCVRPGRSAGVSRMTAAAVPSDSAWPASSMPMTIRPLMPPRSSDRAELVLAAAATGWPGMPAGPLLSRRAAGAVVGVMGR